MESSALPQTSPAEIHVTALMACHNRREITLRCLRSLFRSTVRGVRLDVVLVDDGSTDGTSDAVRSLARPVTIVPGPGNWFWARSMAEAETVAERSDPDVLLWLNDDVELSPTALVEIVHALRRRPDAVLVGGLEARDHSKITYSGFRWSDRGVDLIRKVRPNGAFQELEGFHGNVVAVPRSARRRIGGIDGRWPHNFGDLDYARRLGASGIAMLLLPNVVGTCDGHVPAYMEPSRSRSRRLRAAFGRTGWPLAANWRFHRRHRLPLVSRHFTSPYRHAWRGGRSGSGRQDGPYM